MGVVLEIRTAAGELVTPTGPGEHSWVLEESRSYRLRATHGAILQARLDVRDLPRIDPRTVDLTVGFWTAQCRELHVVVSDRVVPASVRVVPRAEKLDEATWLRLVDDLEAWLPGLSVGAGGGTTGGVAIEGVDSPGFAAAALLPLVPALLLALRAVTTRPREHSIETSEYVRLRMIRRADAGSLGWLTRHGSAAVAVDAWRSLTAVGPEPHLPQWRSEENLDHPVNRYVVWALDRARSRLETLADRLTRFAGDGDGDTAVWCRARADAARASALQVAAIRTRSFLRGIRPAPPTETSMLAVRDDPAYSRFHKLVRPFLSPRFARDQDDPSAPARPTYELYELWTFLAISRALAARLPDRSATWRSRESVDRGGGRSLDGMTFELGGDGKTMRVHFNMTFGSFFAGRRDMPHSISGERRPDIVVESAHVGSAGAWMFLDAKYRVAQRSLYEAFESVHIYQHALRWPASGGRATAGYLLVPAMIGDTAEWFSPEFHRAHDCGCFVLRPGGDPAPIVDEILATLDWSSVPSA